VGATGLEPVTLRM